MKIVLLTEFFEHPNPERGQELMECLSMNLQNPGISEILLFVESRFKLPDHIIASEKIKQVQVDQRATFMKFFEVINLIHKPNTVYIVANLDIYFDASVNRLKEVGLENTFLCLSRWNLKGYCGTPNGEPLSEDKLQWNTNDSHDCWITTGPVRASLMKNASFSMGVPGCDGRLCYLIQQAGYRTINPCEDVRAYHKHLTGGYLGHRTYTEKERLAGPYGRVSKTKLQ
jgi:hypothetical protein